MNDDNIELEDLLRMGEHKWGGLYTIVTFFPDIICVLISEELVKRGPIPETQFRNTGASFTDLITQSGK